MAYQKIDWKKWIAEIHDPMVIRDNPEDDGTRPRKKKDARFLQKLEHLICQDADHVWWFTQGALDYAKLRNPELGNKGFVVFPGAIPPGASLTNTNYQKGEKLHISHFGSLANDRSIAPILQVLPEFFKRRPEALNRIQIDVYGAGLDDNTVEHLKTSPYQDQLQAHGRIENDPVSGKSGRQRIMEIMRSSDILLMLHGDYEWCAEYIPSKMYDYFWAYRPIWAITNRNAQLDQMIQERHHYLSHTLEPETMIQTLETIWQDWLSEQLRIPVGEPISPRDAVQTIIHQCT